MGLCFSKKKQQPPPPPQPPNETKKPNKKAVATAAAAAASEEQPKKPAKPAEPAVADKKPVFVVNTAAAAAPPPAAGNAEEKKPATVAAAVEEVRVAVRTSSCTKEEVDAILIQCGRLSRSSSGKAASGEASGGGHRRYSGSKRSYDFDHERRGGGEEEYEWERQAAAGSRPSPHRRTPERKRSGSRERSAGNGGGSRRVSRSPGRRSEGAPASSCGGERARQPAKMVSVPAREKGRAASPAASGKRCASPRSNSPARAAAAAASNENANQATQTPSLSRSSSRKAEQSPYRRNPMAELDENSLRNTTTTTTNAKSHKKPAENAIAVQQKTAERARAVKEKEAVVEPEAVEAAARSETKAPSAAKSNATHTVSIVAESLNPRAGPGSRSSRRSSRDFDHNPNSYASLLLEDIQNYHQQSTTAAATPALAFSLPACVSKACSIVEAVADLNSSSSENRSFETERSANDRGSINGRQCKTGPLVVESEIVVKDDLTEPSLHKYVSVRDIRGEAEPQESAGSNSFPGHPWASGSWEPNSVDSTDRTWTVSQSDIADEVEQDQSQQSKQKALSQEGGRPRAGSASGSGQRGRSVHRGGGGGNGSIGSGRSGVRAVSASS